MKSWYRSWFNSPYYHLLYADRDEKEAAVFINNLVEHLKPEPGSRMLDVACGNGRHARQLSLKGFGVTGIDLSENSIEEAEKYQSENLHFFVHDMRKLFWINYFDFTFNFFTSFGYFETIREHQQALRMMSCSLREKGLLVLDYFNPAHAERELIPFAEKKMGHVLFEIRKKIDGRHFIKEITVYDEETQNTSRFSERVAKFSAEELSGMLLPHQLKVREIFGDYSLAAFDPGQSPRIIIIAEKTGH